MRLVLQRVSEARVDVDGSTVGTIRTGFVVLLGISRGDTVQEADYLLDKTINLRVFPDEAGKMNRNIQEAGGALLIVSQFTLYADCRKGRRPAFDRAAPPEQAQTLYEYFLSAARRTPVPVESGVFQATMKVSLINEGPVTIWLDSDDRTRKIG
jgi:D-tyrosyl-tRNA(Tyr) deacylase